MFKRQVTRNPRQPLFQNKKRFVTLKVLFDCVQGFQASIWEHNGTSRILTKMLKDETSAKRLAVQGSMRGEAPLLHLGAAFVVLYSCFEACLWHLVLIEYAIHHLDIVF